MNTGPFCACQRVVYRPTEHENGSKSSLWVCESCGAEFMRAPRRTREPAPHSGPSDPRADELFEGLLREYALMSPPRPIVRREPAPSEFWNNVSDLAKLADNIPPKRRAASLAAQAIAEDVKPSEEKQGGE